MNTLRSRCERGLLVLGLLVAALGCQESVPERLSVVPVEPLPPCNTPFETVVHSFFGPQMPQLRVIGDRAEWCALWDQIVTDADPKGCDESLIDFDREVAIVAALGPRPTTGFDVKIACVQRDDGSGDTRGLAVESIPGLSCVTGQAFTSPVEVVKVARTMGAFTFENKSEVYECH